MIVQALFFYLFAAVCVASAFMVIAARNPVHSVLFLILAFVNAAGLVGLMCAEFLAVGLVGAVLLAELLIVVGAWVIGPNVATAVTAPIPAPSVINKTQALGLVLYTR